MSVKGFRINNKIHKYDYNSLDNNPIPSPKASDAGKAIVVDDEGNYVLGEVSSSSGTHIYGAKWDGVHAQMTRYGDSMKFPLGVSNFNTANGTLNSSYNNPFDNLYPWSGRKLCNISVETYMGLQSGDSIKDCVTHWEDEAGFSYDDPDGVWVYTPEFWGRSFDSNGSRCYEVADKEVEGFIHYTEQITSRWRGSSEEREINGETKTILLSKKGGVPCGDVPLSEIHQYAKNAGMTLDTIYNLDGSLLLYLVEYANQNAQYAIGMGCVNLYKKVTTTAATSNDKVLQFAKTSEDDIPVGGIFAVSGGLGQPIIYYTITSVAVNSNDNTKIDVTVDKNITVGSGDRLELRFMSNRTDEEIGSGSGFVGVSEKTLAYYRGESLWGNQFYYVLGIYNHDGQAYVCTSDDESDNYDAYDAEHHVATGIHYAQGGGRGPIKALGFAEGFSTGLGATELGEPADYENPVGDEFFAGILKGDTILYVGGDSNGGKNGPARCGPWCWYLDAVADGSVWVFGGRPRLKHP